MGRRSKSQRARARQNPRYDNRVKELIASQADGPPAKGPGRFHWRWRLGLFENAAQVANALHVLEELSVTDAAELVEEVQREHDGADTDPRLIWEEAKRRLKEREQ